MEDNYKEVYFHEFCESCKHSELENTDEPCNECLDNPLNVATHRPVKYEVDEEVERRDV